MRAAYQQKAKEGCVLLPRRPAKDFAPFLSDIKTRMRLARVSILQKEEAGGVEERLPLRQKASLMSCGSADQASLSVQCAGVAGNPAPGLPPKTNSPRPEKNFQWPCIFSGLLQGSCLRLP